MPTFPIRKDIFRRGVRMTHRFGETEKQSDPFGSGTFEAPWPMRVDELNKGGHPLEVGADGEHAYRPFSSPIQKPDGSLASVNGPAPDAPQIFGMPVPVGTKRRIAPPIKSDK